MNPRGNYKRELGDDMLEAQRLFAMGYRQTSNRFGMVARVDVPDLDAAMEAELPLSSTGKWNRWDKEDHWRRCYSKDKLEGVDEGVMRRLRRMAGAAEEWRSGTAGPERDMVAVCVDNLGIEELFDRGVEYVVGAFREDGMVAVFDRFGQETECMRCRFRMR